MADESAVPVTALPARDLARYTVERFETPAHLPSRWVVLGEVDAEFPAHALRLFLGGETWKPADAWRELVIASADVPTGRYRVIQHSRSYSSVDEFDVTVRGVLDVQAVEWEAPSGDGGS